MYNNYRVYYAMTLILIYYFVYIIPGCITP